uniref:Ras modification protein ERF4 n=1 Tax=Plectus sambesii TaxID=2011161 RepID=A0A914WRP5_9BILA
MTDMAASGSGDMRIPLTQCRKAFVQRDYSRGLAVRFMTDFPEELQGKIDPMVWQKTITNVNRFFDEAETVGGRSVFETLAGCFSCYMTQFCMTSQYQKKLMALAKFLEEQNKSIYIPSGLFVTDPMERGLRVIEISFLTEAAPTRPQTTYSVTQPMLEPER